MTNLKIKAVLEPAFEKSLLHSPQNPQWVLYKALRVNNKQLKDKTIKGDNYGQQS